MNNILKYLVIYIVTIFINNATAAANTNIVQTDQAKVTLISGSYQDDKIRLGLNIKMKPSWHIYWREPGDTGFPPVLDWKESSNIAGVEFLWPAPERLVQELNPGNILESYVYKDDVTFPVTVTVTDKTRPADIKLNISYAICSDICIPEQADLAINIGPGYNSAENTVLIENAAKLVPGENGSSGLKIESVNKGSGFIEVNASSEHGFAKDATIIIEGGEHYAFKKPEPDINGNNAKFIAPVTFLTDHKDLQGANLRITLINGNNAVEFVADDNSIGNSTYKGKTSNTIFLLMLASALIGGLILNIMPCVLPVLSIKLLGIIKHGGGKNGDVTKSFLITTFGIITSFIALALITISIKAAGGTFGWGMHFQQPSFIIALIIILTLFAANMWGLYEINLPASLSGAGGKYDGALGHFMSGVLATILATPCTAPFLGVAVGFALSRGTFEILSIFLAMGLGLAFPYILLSAFPSLVTRLPKPGKWMINLKKFMGLLLALAAIWLIWVLSNQLGKMAAFILLLLCIIKVLKLWAANHYSIINRLKIPLLIIIIALAFGIPIKISNNGLHTSNSDMWEDFRLADIKPLVGNGKIIFVDVTADWCLTCKVNKFTVLNTNSIKDAFSKAGVIAMRADWTNRDEHISKYLMSYQRAGIPFNIVYGPGAPDGIILSELLSKKEVLEALRRAGGNGN